MRKQAKIALVITVVIGVAAMFWIFKDTGKQVDPKLESGKKLAQSYCGSCHLKPDPGSIPKYYWRDYVLPKMGDFLGVRSAFYNPYTEFDANEAKVLMEANIFPSERLVDSAHWASIMRYYIHNSPDSIHSDTSRRNRSRSLKDFKANRYVIARNSNISLVTGVKYNEYSNEMWVSDGFNRVYIWKPSSGLVRSFSTRSPVIDFDFKPGWSALTEIGVLFPSDRPEGLVMSPINVDSVKVLLTNLRRPVHTEFHDFDNDEMNEIIVCNYGNYIGNLSIYSYSGKRYSTVFKVDQPGAIKSVIRDMNKDGKDDIIVLFAQGDESVSIFYQTGKLQFKAERIIRFPPEYGSSDMEVIDFDKDGYYDIVTVHGDNADYSYFSKPYHGLRLFLNDGENNFDEAYFVPIYGATRLQADDFDKDGDYDFAVTATFPDFENVPNENFVYLENNSSGDDYSFDLQTQRVEVPTHSITLEKGDIDQDGDVDLLMGAFNMSPVPVPSFVSDSWKRRGTEVMILENQLFH